MNCPHRFEGVNHPHYCSYVQVQGLRATFPPWLAGVADHIAYSVCATSVIWLELQELELAAAARAIKRADMGDRARYRALLKRLRRAGAIASLLVQQTEFASAILLRAPLSMQLSVPTPLWPALERIQRQLSEAADTLKFGSDLPDAASVKEVLAAQVQQQQLLLLLQLLDPLCLFQ